MQEWMSPIRKKYFKILQNLTNNADIFSRMYTETGDKGALNAYNHYVKEIKDIKEKIITKEKEDNKWYVGMTTLQVFWWQTLY